MNPTTQRYILKKDHLIPLLRKLMKENRLVAPLCNRQGDTLFTEITNLEKSEIDLANQTQNSLKSFFFPQREKLSTYVAEQEPASGAMRHDFYPHLPENRPTLYFGVRSCDMFAVLYGDVIFLRNGQHDVYYERRRKNALFITLACNKPFANCFCNATRSGPFLELGFDLQLTDLGNRFFVDVGRSGGEKVVRQWPHFFRLADETDRRSQFQLALEARSLFRRAVHVDLAIKLLAEQQEPAALIEDLSNRCQDCGGCAFICPTCTCFTIFDQPLDRNHGERIRAWDACTFAGFTTLAGGHNPVDCQRQRIRKRFLHKLLHDVEKHGRPSCVGCGRCVEMCFGGVDIVRFIDRLSAEADVCTEAGK